jgi:ankyrin repeat protein
MRSRRWAFALAGALAASPAAGQGAKGTFTQAGTTFAVADAFAWEQPKEDASTGETVRSIQVWLADRPLDHKALVAAADLRAALLRVKSRVGLVELELDGKGGWTDIVWDVPTSMSGGIDDEAAKKAAITVSPAGAIHGAIKVKPSDWSAAWVKSQGGFPGPAIDLTLDARIERRLTRAVPGPTGVPEESGEAASGDTTDAAAGAPAAPTAQEARQQLLAQHVDLSNKARTLDSFLAAVMTRDVQKTRLFLEAGFSPNDRRGPPQNDTPLLLAASVGCSDKDAAASTKAAQIIEAMVAHGADANAKADNGNPVLSYAADECPASVIRALVRAGADMNARNAAGFSAMTTAVMSGRTNNVKALLDLGYDVRSELPRLLELSEGRPAIRALLQSPGSRTNGAARKKPS